MKNAQNKKDLAAEVAAVRKELATIGRTVTAIRKDTQFLVYCVPTRVREDVVRVTIEGERLRQFNAVRRYMASHHGCTLYQACQFAWRKSDGGYPTLKSLHRFCLAHYSMIA